MKEHTGCKPQPQLYHVIPYLEKKGINMAVRTSHAINQIDTPHKDDEELKLASTD